MPFRRFLFVYIILILAPYSLFARVPQSVILKSTTPQLQLQQKIQKTPTQSNLQYQGSQWDKQRSAIEQTLLIQICKDLQRGCLRTFVDQARWDLRRDEVEACAVRENPDCQRFPIHNIHIDVWPVMQPPIEMLPGRRATFPGSIDLHFECRHDWEKCQIIYYYDYDNPGRLTFIIRLEDIGSYAPIDPLPDEDPQPNQNQSANEENHCYHPYMITDFGAVTLDEFTLAQINLYGSVHGCYLPDQNGCYQEVSSDHATALRQCPGNFIYENQNGRYSIPCQYKFDRNEFAFAYGLPDDALFCYIHFLRPRRL